MNYSYCYRVYNPCAANLAIGTLYDHYNENEAGKVEALPGFVGWDESEDEGFYDAIFEEDIKQEIGSLHDYMYSI